MRLRAVLLAVLLPALFPVAASANYPHVVQPGETLTSVAAVDGLSIDAIASANGISDESELVVGQILWIPPRTLVTAGSVASDTETTSSTTTDSETSESTATAQTDESTTDAQTAQTEDTSSEEQESSPTSSTSTSELTSSGPQGSYADEAPQPTQEMVDSGEIGYVAEQYGVPAAFAEAIAWQESGWNNAEVSGIGAVGVMQIVPSTWDWIDRYLTPGSPLGTDSASENVRAGVLLLHQLLTQTGGSEQMAAAGYYQGLASVQAHGMYADTQQYVADVLALTARFGG